VNSNSPNEPHDNAVEDDVIENEPQDNAELEPQDEDEDANKPQDDTKEDEIIV